ncbi:hypothetical protein V496_07724 [Pseudogymnoascus sp. VKM F-4515 (FW-2607)]|nr:hypothetical protein V496_07724 [Pseudogymnoascus sp. VKM F-4515 (FW-2607)]
MGTFAQLCAVAGVASILSIGVFPQHQQFLFGSPGYVLAFVQYLILEIALWTVWLVVLYPRYFSPLRHLPQPEGNSFFMGQWPILRNEKTGRPLQRWINDIPNTGLIKYLYMFNYELLMVCSPSALREVLVTKCYDFEKPKPLSRLAIHFFGLGMPFVEGDAHKFQRKMMAPAFAFKHIKNLYPTFWDMSTEIVSILTEEVKKGAGTPKETNGNISPVAPDQAVLEIVRWWKAITLDIMGVAGMGQDFKSRYSEDHPLRQAYFNLFRPSWEAAYAVFVRLVVPLWAFKYIPIKMNAVMEESRETIRDNCLQLIRTKSAQLAKNELTDLDILSCAIQSGGFTEQGLIDQMTIFLLAGHESSSVAMTWATYALCQYPEVQTRLRAEIRANLPSPSGATNVTSFDIEHTPYLNAVCSEVMRFYDVFVWTFREAVVDTTVLGQKIPKGTQLVIPVSAMHRDRKIWGDDADSFNPDRWMPGKANSSLGGADSNFAFMTFNQGPRICIGESFARAEFACLLAAWVGRFEFELNDPRELDDKNYILAGGFGVGPVKGLDIKVRIVDGW